VRSSIGFALVLSCACVRAHDLAGSAVADATGGRDAGPADRGAHGFRDADAGGPDARLGDRGDDGETPCEELPNARCVALDEGSTCPGGSAPIEASCAGGGDESVVVCCPD